MKCEVRSQVLGVHYTTVSKIVNAGDKKLYVLYSTQTLHAVQPS